MGGRCHGDRPVGTDTADGLDRPIDARGPLATVALDDAVHDRTLDGRLA
jgi:hypothetical protein